MKLKLSENIRQRRREAGLTQEQLAEALGVTAGAVYKWESGRAAPELGLLVELAQFFGVSVDALLDYGWESLDMGQTADRLRQCIRDRRLEEGLKLASQVLQKYPNSFRVVWESAELHFLTMDPALAPKAVELYRRALQLMDQNTDSTIGPAVLQSRIAACLCRLGRTDEAVELLKRNNVGGINNVLIGLLLSQEESKAEEALPWLSDALLKSFSQLFNTCVGYACACGALERYDEALDILRWMLALERGLRKDDTVCWMDQGEARLLTMTAEMELRRGDRPAAREALTQARERALRFDAAPEYRAAVGMKFYHGSGPAACYDDMGETAMESIGNYLKEAPCLQPLWEEVEGNAAYESTVPGNSLPG
ncbi:MAG: helix-turn-helix transcriptional regulator [Oscillospiraceae bacterium]|nr:helix-turn-helix transcriptional regulator [Oscillospiraceae bacterium]